MALISIAIAEGHSLVRQGLVTTLRNNSDFSVLFDAKSATELLENLIYKPAGIVLLGINSRKDDLSIFRILKNKYPSVKVVALAPKFSEQSVSELISYGVAGFLHNNCDIEVIINAIHIVKQKGKYFDPEITEMLANKMRAAELNDTESKKLTDRQVEILKLLYDEKNSEEIATVLFLSRRTVEWHKIQIFEKVGCKSTIGAIKYGLTAGIIRM